MKYIKLSNEEVQTKAIQDEMTETKTAIAIDITGLGDYICPIKDGEYAVWDYGSQQIIQAVIWAMLYDYKDVYVQFEDGTIVKHINKAKFNKGYVKNPNFKSKKENE